MKAFIMAKFIHIFTKPHIFFLVFSLVFSACLSSEKNIQNENQSEAVTQAAEESFTIPTPDINLTKPLEISQKPEDIELAKKIDEIIEKSEFANARWGIFVVSLKDGRVLVAKDARKLFNPASIQKILTSIVALDKLGADFRWKTHVFAPNQIDANGNINSDLTLYGEGAPDFDEAGIENLANQLQAKGLKRVNGSIVGDESFFKGENLGEGWTWNDLQWHYGTETSALTFKENQAAIYMQDGKPTASTDYIELAGELKPLEKERIKAAGLQRGLGDNQFYVWGNGDEVYGRVAVHDAPLWAARELKKALEKKGIAVEGNAKSANWKSENKLNTETAIELAAVESQTLAEVVQKMNKRSINLYGELILRTIGKKFGSEAPAVEARVQELRGDDAAGTAFIKKWLKEKNVATEEIQIHDGSGLSRLDFITPEAFGRALIYAAQANFADVFKNSLPIAGTDGTLGGRLWKEKGKILAKTGSITYVNSLAGYANNLAVENTDKPAERTREKAADKRNEETLAFAIICNNQTRKSESTRVVDAIAASLVGSLDTEEKLKN